MNINNKKGIGMNFLIPLILGLIMVGVSLFFIFHEYWTEEDLSREVCRQSIQVRAAVPDMGDIPFVSLKDQYPLKCKNSVISIEENNTEQTENIIAEAMAECWYLFLEGEDAIFPEGTQAFESYCVPCTRIHFTKEVQEYYQGQNRIDMQRALARPLANTGVSYKQYLAKAFIPVTRGSQGLAVKSENNEGQSIIEGNTFWVDDDETTGIIDTIQNVFVGGQGTLHLPQYLDSKKGDLMVFFQQSIQSEEDKSSILVYFQTQQKDKNGDFLDPFKELQKDFQEQDAYNNAVCDFFDGIPA